MTGRIFRYSWHLNNHTNSIIYLGLLTTDVRTKFIYLLHIRFLSWKVVFLKLFRFLKTCQHVHGGYILCYMTYIMVMLPLLKLTLNAVCMLKGCIYFEHKAQQGSEQIIDFLGNVEVMSSCNM